MPKYSNDYDEDDYYDEEDYDDTQEYIDLVKKKLKQLKISDNEVLRQLEIHDYDVDETVAAFKAHAAKIKQKEDTTKKSTPRGIPGATTNSTVVKKESSNHKTQKSSSGAESKLEVPKSAPEPTSVFRADHADGVEQLDSNNAGRKGELALSDDERIIEIEKRGAEPTESGGSTEVHDELTLVVAGHVDAGKSTLIGNMLYKIGEVQQRTIHKYEKDSQAIGKGSFGLAWVTDENTAEREHGVTIGLAERRFRSANRKFTVLDAPGHRDFIPTLIKGATQADVALLVVPASAGEYESSMKDTAQTKEHAVLLKALGVNQVIVVVNKMDNVLPQPWAAERYFEIEARMRLLLVNEMNFADRLVRAVPVSGFTGQNVVKLDDDCPLRTWYSGPTLIELMDSFKVPTRQLDRPFRAAIHGTPSSRGETVGDISKGKYLVDVTVMQGKIGVGRSVAYYEHLGMATVIPAGESVNAKKDENMMDEESGLTSEIKKVNKTVVTIVGIRKVDRDGGDEMESVNELSAGERGSLQLSNRYLKGADTNIRDGTILFKGPALPITCSEFKATILTMSDIKPPIIPGSRFELYLNGMETQCHVLKLHSVGNSNSSSAAAGNTAKRPKCVGGGKTAVISISIDQPSLIEPFTICRALGRFALRDKGKTIAVGICEKLLS